MRGDVTNINVPADGWEARPHQLPLWNYLAKGGKRAVAVWHRRAGKDEILLNWMARSAIDRAASYWYCLPEYAQCRRAIWTSVNPHTGRRRIDEAFPHEIRASAGGTNESEMFLRLVNGSTIQLIGSDNYSTAVGASPAGVVFSEYSLANPSAWGYFRPMVEENGGWAAFISTPRGRNHLFQLANYAAAQPGWFYEQLTAVDTGAISAEALAESLREYQALYGTDMGQALYDQELMCSFNAAILGAIYAHEMAAVRSEGRITADAVAIADRPVHRAWDLGVKDDTAIWFYQVVGAQLVVLDHYAASGVGLEHFADVIERKHAEHGWLHGTDWVPTDAKVKELGTGRTRVETMQALGLRPQLVPHATVEDGVNAVRRTLPITVFHPRTEETGIAALEQYRREWDDEKKAFRASAVHDWTSHPADAFRYLAMSWRPTAPRKAPAPRLEGWVIPPPREVQRGRGEMRL